MPKEGVLCTADLSPSFRSLDSTSCVMYYFVSRVWKPRVIAEPEGEEVGPRDLGSHKGIKYYARSPHIIFWCWRRKITEIDILMLQSFIKKNSLLPIIAFFTIM